MPTAGYANALWLCGSFGVRSHIQRQAQSLAMWNCWSAIANKYAKIINNQVFRKKSESKTS
ncbi:MULTISPECIES: hypothetical protein [Aerosakkonema]|uniref:hypothetical protein n=1 Tax=Aerosakkonema TaxID=1246629 RepID=UPI0035B96BD3